MSDRRDTAGEAREHAPVTGEAPGSDAERELLALEEQILAEGAAGRRSLLATYLRRYPEHTEALIAFASELPMGGAERGHEDAEASSARELSAAGLGALPPPLARAAPLPAPHVPAPAAP